MSDGLFGLDAEIAEKLLAKRDAAFEQETMEWVANVLGLPNFTGDVLTCLKSGVILCRLSFFFFLLRVLETKLKLLTRLMNKLVPGTLATFNEEGKIRSPLQEVENLQIYLKVWSFALCRVCA